MENQLFLHQLNTFPERFISHSKRYNQVYRRLYLVAGKDHLPSDYIASLEAIADKRAKTLKTTKGN